MKIVLVDMKERLGSYSSAEYSPDNKTLEMGSSKSEVRPYIF